MPASALPGPPLRIAVLGDFDGPHTRRWIEVFVARGHDLHAISFYRPRAELAGVRLHILSRADASSDSGRSPATGKPFTARAPRGALRLVYAWRYRRAGLRPLLDSIAPDIFHAHYVVEHGFYGAFADYHPYVVSAWGSDLLVEPRTPFGRAIARYTLSRADLITANDASLARRAVELGTPEERVHVVRLGIDDVFFSEPRRSVNLEPRPDAPHTILSNRALEPLYNIDVVLRAFAALRDRLPTARLVVINDGSERARLESVARDLGLNESVRFTGRFDTAAVRQELEAAQVYVSVPSSDSFSLSTLEAMATGSFPIVSDLPSQAGIIEDGLNGLVVPVRDAGRLAAALHRALTDAELRQRAAGRNREMAEAEGRRETNMLALERLYYRLAGHPVGGAETI